MDNKFLPGQAEITALRIGNTRLGVRTNRPDVNRLIQRLLPEHVVASAGASPNMSLLFGDDTTRNHPLHFFSRSGVGVLRSTSPGRLVRALLQHLSEYVESPAPDVAKITSWVLVKDGKAVLVHPGAITNLYAMESRLRRLGWQMLDVPTAPIHLTTGQLHVGPPRLSVNRGAEQDLQLQYPVGKHEVQLDEPRTFSVSAWIVPQDQLLPGLPDSPAAVALALSSQVSTLQQLPAHQAVAAVSQLLHHTDLRLMDRRNDLESTEAVLASL